jgi:hypothetical protein
MILVRNSLFGTVMSFLAFAMMLVAAACGIPMQLPRGAVGNVGRVNYSPSVIENEGTRHFWWCSSGVNPADHSQNTDAIFYQSVNVKTLQHNGPPILVLAESPGKWDSAYTCNPKVIAGRFKNPLGDGQTYPYAMYYVATGSATGLHNSIGVAFSNDGIYWRKYPQPVIHYTSEHGYGVGQPSLYYDDVKSVLWLFYEENDLTGLNHVAAVSKDGVHFTVQGTLTTNGLNLDNPEPTWGDMAYEPKAGEWYAIFNSPLRPTSSTGGIPERGQYGIELYKIPKHSLLTGGSWRQLSTMDTNATGFESNFIAALVHDPYGNINLGPGADVKIYASISYPPVRWDATPMQAAESTDIANWILFPMQLVPSSESTVPLNRYFNRTVHEVTTGWISPDGGFEREATLGHLYSTQLHNAVLRFYSCKRERTDYFLSLDLDCEGQRMLGTIGYAYPQPVSGLNLVALYRCSTGHDHFVSRDPKCEGQKTDLLLGYVLP